MNDPITRVLDELRHECTRDAEPGRVADYIPELTHADPEAFGIVLESHDGDVYAAGDADVEFTIQSISKPFVYALAVEALGVEAVDARVGAEPSGEPFNAISLEPGTGRPANPLVNAGAILTTSLVPGGFDRIAEGLSAFAGHTLAVDDAVHASERETGDRNIAIAHLMRAAGALEGDVHAVVDDYFRQCSLIVTARDLAYMAATLANAGRDPATDAPVVSELTVQHTLSVMATCGMYDGAGEWMLHVGLPAKSGVSGGVLAVSPGQFGIGLYSPPLDARGNSVRAVLACERLAARFGLHIFHDATAGARAAKVTERDGVLVLRGDIDFAAAERALRLSRGRTPTLDLTGVTRLHPVAERLLETISNDHGGDGT
ncbi:glutaminase A [Solirubrobacter phytolaccae]|uniref:Glutaminase n=1 Tax=Solirubrobacter phytolaccae TaxID=1404360 RepID=A0A9X3SJD8_9ACTN|nr:glutaminase A [Solirubrobacter phytolaccae]MDA0185162.1 glutaminase A [Solirubrobacter phytolaccae]